jgi:hypothetical protein
VHATAAGPARTSARPTPGTTTTTATPDAPIEAPGASPSLSAQATTAPPTTAAPPVTYTGTVEGEAASFSGPDARSMSCGFCSGGRIAGWIGFTNALTFTDVRVATTRAYQLTITYVGDDRSFYVSVNGGPGARVALFQGSWNEARTATLSITLNAGTANTIRFYNTTDWTPDLDKITIG